MSTPSSRPTRCGPLIELAEELSGRSYSDGGATTRAMRILADHSRGTAALIADGVVPSNEDRGYVLRRIMRRAIQQGRSIGLAVAVHGALRRPRARPAGARLSRSSPPSASNVLRWAADEEESFGRTLERGTQMLADLIRHAHEDRTSWIDAEDAFRLHDTYGFPYDLTKELLAEQGLSVDDEGFEELMEEQRARARMGTATAHGSEDHHGAVLSFASAAPPSRFVGYEKLRAETSLLAVAGRRRARPGQARGEPLLRGGRRPGRRLGRGPLGWRQRPGRRRLPDRRRPGGRARSPLDGLAPGARVEAEVDHVARFATMRNHTATHLLHAALRERLGTHVRQAGSAVRPDKLRFDFTHGAPLTRRGARATSATASTSGSRRATPCGALEMSRMEAERLGAMALFGEKYGDWVRVVEVEGVSRELCGGTHVANTAAIGIFAIASEGSSAANVRRIEALTGPAGDRLVPRPLARALARSAGSWARSRTRSPARAARPSGSRSSRSGRRRRAPRTSRRRPRRSRPPGHKIGGITVFVGRGEDADQRSLLDLADRIKSRAGAAAVVLGGAGDGKVALVASFSKEVIDRGLSAADVIREAAQVIGGGGGGRENVAQAGGRDPAKLDEALAAARKAIEAKLTA